MTRILSFIGSLLILITLIPGGAIALMRWGQLGLILQIDWSRALTRPDDGSLVILGLTLIGWIAWILLTASVLVEAIAACTKGAVRIRLPGTGIFAPATAVLVASIAGLVASNYAGFGAPASDHHAGQAAVATVTDTQAHADSHGHTESPTHADNSSHTDSLTHADNTTQADSQNQAATQSVAPSTWHTVTPGDDLWSLAEHYYGHGDQWHRIVEANSTMVLSPLDQLSPGLLLEIPGPEANQLSQYGLDEHATGDRTAHHSDSDSPSRQGAQLLRSHPAQTNNDLLPTGVGAIAVQSGDTDPRIQADDASAGINSSDAPVDDQHDESASHTVAEGETLWDIAHERLGDPQLWPQIQQDNQLADPDLIMPGQTLSILNPHADETAPAAEDDEAVPAAENESVSAGVGTDQASEGPSQDSDGIGQASEDTDQSSTDAGLADESADHAESSDDGQQPDAEMTPDSPAHEPAAAQPAGIDPSAGEPTESAPASAGIGSNSPAANESAGVDSTEFGSHGSGQNTEQSDQGVIADDAQLSSYLASLVGPVGASTAAVLIGVVALRRRWQSSRRPPGLRAPQVRQSTQQIHAGLHKIAADRHVVDDTNSVIEKQGPPRYAITIVPDPLEVDHSTQDEAHVFHVSDAAHSVQGAETTRRRGAHDDSRFGDEPPHQTQSGAKQLPYGVVTIGSWMPDSWLSGSQNDLGTESQPAVQGSRFDAQDLPVSNDSQRDTAVTPEPALIDLLGRGYLSIEIDDHEISAGLQANLAVQLAGQGIHVWVPPVLGWLARLDLPEIHVLGDAEMIVETFYQTAQAREQSLGRDTTAAQMRQRQELSEAWAPAVYCLAEACSYTPDQLRRWGLAVIAPAPAGHQSMLSVHDASAWCAGQPVDVDYICPPARRAVEELLDAAESTDFRPAWWWTPDSDLPESVIPLQPQNQPSLGEELPVEATITSPTATGAPFLNLIGPIELVNARGPRPSRAQRQCVEYCAWIHRHPGSIAPQMTRQLMVADTTRRSNMSRLRTWLGHDDDGQPYLPEAYSGHIGLHPDISSDWDELTLLIKPGVNCASDEALRKGLSLVRGAPLADAAPGEWSWAESWRCDMVATIRDMGVTLAQRCLDRTDLATARWAIDKALLAAPDDELLMCLWLQIEHRAGNQQAAQRLVLQITRHARLMGTDLMDETVHILQQVMEGRTRARGA